MNGFLSEGQRDETGQVLVLFIVSLAVLMGLVALVVDVGAWLGTHQKLQSIADGAALAAVEQGQVDSSVTDNNWAILNPDPSSLNPAAPPTSFTVTASHEAPVIFGAVVGITGFNESATATAQSLPVSAVANSDLTTVAKPPPPATEPPYVTPIVVNQCVFQQTCVCWFTMDCANQNLANCTNPSVGCDLTFDPQDRTDSLFGIAQISTSGVNFANWVRCGPCAPGTIVTNPSTGCPNPAQWCVPPLSNGTSGGGPAGAMNAAKVNTLIFPVFNGFTNNTYNLVGFSAFVVTTPTFTTTAGSGNWQNENVMTCGVAHSLCCGHAIDTPCKIIHGYFTQYNLPALFKNAQLGVGSTADYGVRGVGLTK